MREGPRTVVATLVAAVIVISAVAAVVPYLDDDDGVRTGYFDRFPRDFAPGEKDYGTPEEAYAEFRRVLDANRPVIEDPRASDEAKEDARDRVREAFDVLFTEHSLFTADYYCDASAYEGERQKWDAVFERSEAELDAILGGDPQRVPEEFLEEMSRLDEEEIRLIGEYRTAVAECSVVCYEGELYNILDSILPVDVRIAAARVISDRCGPLMLDLVDVRNRQAEIMGYDSYADYAFHEENSDDLTFEEVQDLVDFIVRNFEMLYGCIAYPWMDFRYEDADDIPDAISPFLNEVSGDFGRLLDYLMDNDLFYSEPDLSKYPININMPLPSHGSSLIYIGPPYDDLALPNAIHEFGHAAYACFGSSDLGDKDILEMHSHGLQLLAAGNAGTIVPGKAAEFAILSVSAVLGSLVTSTVTSHIEAMLYDGAFETTDDIVNELRRVYGTADGLTEYLWCINSQIFEDPFYSPSYVTAIVTSLGILAESVEDWDSAADRYLGLLSSDAVGYHAIVADAGLPDVFEDGTAADILWTTIEYQYGLIEDVFGPLPEEVRDPATSEVPA